jgi:predicted outer membrane protein
MRKQLGIVGALVAIVVAGIVTTRADAAPAALDEAGVVAIFDLANVADIETGRLAAQRAESKEVRDFGKMLTDVHTAVRQQGQDLAKKLGVTPALPRGDTLGEQHAAVMTRLSKLSRSRISATRAGFSRRRLVRSEDHAAAGNQE